MPDPTPQDVRPASWQDVIAAEAAKQQVDPRLALAVADVESSFNPAAKSSAGAIGLMQLMPDTAARLKVDPTDPLQNIKGGITELKTLLDNNGGDVTKALRLYNASPGADPSVTDPYVTSVLSKIAPASNAPQTPKAQLPADAFNAELKSAIEGQSAEPGKPPESPSWLSLAGTTAKRIGRNVVMAPAAALADMVMNAGTRSIAAGKAGERGDIVETLKQSALENPIIRLADQMVVEPAIEQGKKTIEAVKQGRYAEAAGHAAATALPMVGPFAAQAGEEIGSGDPTTIAEGVGDAISLLAGGKIAEGGMKLAGKTAGAIGKLLPGDEPTAAATLMARAARPNSNNPAFVDRLPRAMRELKAVEQARGTPAKTAGELIDDIKTAKDANRQQFAQLTDPHKAMGSTIDGTPVADAMVASIPERTRLQEPQKVAEIERKADTYRRDIPTTQAGTLLEGVNAELDSYFQKNPAAKRAQAKSNPDTAAIVAEGTALRKQYYDKLDPAGGGEAARELQLRYGSLNELERALLKRKNPELTSGPDQLVQSVGKFAAARDVVRGGVKLFTGNPAGAALDLATAVAERGVGKYIAEQRLTDTLIRRAMAAHQGLPKPIQMPATAVIRGALPAPAIQLPAVPPGPQPPIAQRGQWGRQLPQLPQPAMQMGAASKGPIYSGEGTVPILQGELVEEEPPIARRGTWGERWVPTPKQIAAAPPAIRGFLERGAIRLGRTPESVRGRPVSAADQGPIPLAASATWMEGPSDWEVMLEQPKPGSLSAIELRELERIHAELEHMPFQKRFSTDTGPYGQREWHAGAAGAPVYDDVLEAPDPEGFKKDAGVGKPSRSKMAQDIYTAMKGGRISRVAAKAIVVARARAVGAYPEEAHPEYLGGRPRLTRPKLAPWWESEGEEPQP